MRNNIVKRTTRLAAALVAAFFFAGAAADPIVAVGSAPMDAGVAAARELAIQDALHQAALTQGAVVESAQVMDSGQDSESASLSADAVSGRVQVIDEHEQDGMYQVRIRFDPQAPGVPGARCAAPAGRHLLRRVSTAYFIVDHPADASDLESVGSRLPHEFASRMNARHGDALSVRDAGNVTIMPDPYQTDPHLAADNARKLALSEDAQFVVAGRLVSTQITDRSVRPSLFHSDEQTQQGMYYQGPLYQLIGGALEYRAVKRQFDFELWVFDGLTGALLANQRYAIEAEGNVLPREAPQFASAAFWKTDYGEPVSTLLNQAADRVAADCPACGCLRNSAPTQAEWPRASSPGGSFFSARFRLWQRRRRPSWR